LEAGVKYEEIEIDLQNKPEWYWKINQQGKVPALDFGGDILIESSVISEVRSDFVWGVLTQFVVDLFREAALFPYGTDTTSAMQRARARQFVEIFLAKVNTFYYGAIVRGEPNVINGLVESIEKFLVPVLPDTPFVLGDKFALPEILTSPFVLRIYLLAKLGLLGEGAEAKLAAIPKWDKWARGVLANESVRATFELEKEGRKAIDRIRKVREVLAQRAAAQTNRSAGSSPKPASPKV